MDISKYPESVRDSLRKAIDLQQNFYELSSDWNYYESSEHKYLKKNIRYSICGRAEEDYDEDLSQDESETEVELDSKQIELEKIVDLVYSRILEASTHSLYVGTIFNVLCNIGEKDAKFVSSVPIFKVKRCLEKSARSTSVKKYLTPKKKIGTTVLYSCCVYYIDTEGRIYKNWTDYVTNNTLPKALMVLPMGGFYQADPHVHNTAEKTSVWLEIGSPPLVKKILPYFDIASTALGLGALTVGIGALAAPVAILAAPIAAPIMLAGTVAGAVSGVYATARSTQQLVDRGLHKQSISVTDRTARSAWFGVVGGVAGGIASGSTFVLNRAVRAGMTVGNVGRSTYNAIGIGNIAINGMGIGNGVYSMYRNYQETKEVSALEVAQVVAHVLFFGNAVVKFQTARTIINNTQQQVLQDYEQSLRSNRHRKAFKRIKRNTQASSSDSTTADSEIIRGIRPIENKDDFFAGVVRNRKIFNANNAEVTFKDGYAMINDNVRFDPVELSQQPTDVRVNTVGAAEPLIRTSSSALPAPGKMLEPTFMEKFNTFKEIVGPLVPVGQGIKLAVANREFIRKLILDLKGYTKEDFKNLVAQLARLALKVVQEHRIFITNSFEEIMHYIWYSYVRPRVDSQLQEMGVDVSDIVKFSGFSKFVYDITQAVINEIYNGLEKFLEEIIEGFSKRPEVPKPTRPAVCTAVLPPPGEMPESTFMEKVIKISKSALPPPGEMLQSIFMEKVNIFKETVGPLVSIGQGVKLAVVSRKSLTFIGQLILDMAGYTKEDFKDLIAQLARLALKGVQEHRIVITNSWDEIMLYVWHSCVRPKIDSSLQEAGIDVSDIDKFFSLSKVVYYITRGLIDEIYNSLENFLEIIIEDSSKLPVVLKPTRLVVCTICSGYTLTD